MVKKIMPQEIEVWYLLPALRRELAKILIKDHKLSQKKVADIFGVTEAAISQYISSKRGVEIKFSKKEEERIKKSASEIAKNKSKAMDEIYKLCVYFRGSDLVCKVHKRYDSSVPKHCRLCSRKL